MARRSKLNKKTKRCRRFPQNYHQPSSVKLRFEDETDYPTDEGCEEVDPITLESIPRRYQIRLRRNSHLQCYDVRSLYQALSLDNRDPLTRIPFSRRQLERITQKYRAEVSPRAGALSEHVRRRPPEMTRREVEQVAFGRSVQREVPPLRRLGPPPFPGARGVVIDLTEEEEKQPFIHLTEEEEKEIDEDEAFWNALSEHMNYHEFDWDVREGDEWEPSELEFSGVVSESLDAIDMVRNIYDRTHRFPRSRGLDLLYRLRDVVKWWRTRDRQAYVDQLEDYVVILRHI